MGVGGLAVAVVEEVSVVFTSGVTSTSAASASV